MPEVCPPIFIFVPAPLYTTVLCHCCNYSCHYCCHQFCECIIIYYGFKSLISYSFAINSCKVDNAYGTDWVWNNLPMNLRQLDLSYNHFRQSPKRLLFGLWDLNTVWTPPPLTAHLISFYLLTYLLNTACDLESSLGSFCGNLLFDYMWLPVNNGSQSWLCCCVHNAPLLLIMVTDP